MIDQSYHHAAIGFVATATKVAAKSAHGETSFASGDTVPQYKAVGFDSFKNKYKCYKCLAGISKHDKQRAHDGWNRLADRMNRNEDGMTGKAALKKWISNQRIHSTNNCSFTCIGQSSITTPQLSATFMIGPSLKSRTAEYHSFI
jgi:hypothetical protein